MIVFACDFPHGGKDDWLLHQFKEKLQKDGGPTPEDAMEFATSLKKVVDSGTIASDE